MNQGLSASQIQRIENNAIKKVGIPSVVLMENAGCALAHTILSRFSEISKLYVNVICGTGNNGGDGLVAARHLWLAGAKVDVVICGLPHNLKEDSQVFYQVLRQLRIPVIFIKTVDGFIRKRLKKADVLVDALFGIGLNRPLENLHLQMIKIINENARNIVSADIPSGLDATTGKVWGNCVKASTTVSFSCLKKGFSINLGPQYTGVVQVVDIGIPHQLIRKQRKS